MAVASLAGQGCMYILSQMQLRKAILFQSIKDEPEAEDVIPIISDSDEVQTTLLCVGWKKIKIIKINLLIKDYFLSPPNISVFTFFF